MNSIVAVFVGLIACGPVRHSATKATSATTVGPNKVEKTVRYRPSPEPTAAHAELVLGALPNATWDSGLLSATQELVSLATSRTAIFSPDAVSTVTANAGFPGQPRFVRKLNGGAFPESLINQAAAVHGDIDVALVSRVYGDGAVMWVLAWAPHVAEIDPLLQHIALDDTLSVRVDFPSSQQSRLYVASPDGPVEEISLTSGVSRYVDLFHSPGEWRLEVVGQVNGNTKMAHLFSVFVDSEQSKPSMLPSGKPEVANPSTAEKWLYGAVNEVRKDHGLVPLKRFELFEPIAREHSALMASANKVAHKISNVAVGVEKRASEIAHPRAVFHENVVASLTAKDALDLIVDSPAHLKNLLCEKCTHVSIGASIEPVLNRIPRLFVTVEVVEMNEGEPRAIDHYNR